MVQTEYLCMKHPNRVELMSYFYDELEREPRRMIERHLGQCEPCQTQLAQWRATARQLDTYAVSGRRTLQPAWQPLTRWALVTATAAAVLLVGFAIGRMTSVSRTELEAMKRDVETHATSVARAEAQQQLQQFVVNVSKRLDTLRAQQTSDYTLLRRELETVAVLTEASFQQTEKKMFQLADTRAAATVNPIE